MCVCVCKAKKKKNVPGKAASDDAEAAACSPKDLAEIINERGCTKQQILNGDETGFYWKKMPSRTVIPREKSIPGFKGQADSLLLGSNAAGEFKVKPIMLIYQSENPRTLKNYAKSTLYK